MGETKPYKIVIHVGIGTLALIIICVLLTIALGATIGYYTLIENKDSAGANRTIEDQIDTIASLNASIANLTKISSQLQVWLDGNETVLHQLEASLNISQTCLKGNITNYETQISLLRSQINQTQTWLNGNITSYNSRINSLNLQITDYEARMRGIWNISNIQFDLDDLDHFMVNVTNAPASLGVINIMTVEINQNITSTNSIVIAPASSSVVVCGSNWTRFIGANVTVTVRARAYGQNETTVSQTLVIPCLKVTNASFSNFPTGTPYVNITLFNSKCSPTNTNITQISVTANNVKKLVDGTMVFPSISPSGYLLPIGKEVTFVYPWNWSLYSGQNVTFTVTPAQGPPASATFKVG